MPIAAFPRLPSAEIGGQHDAQWQSFVDTLAREDEPQPRTSTPEPTPAPNPISANVSNAVLPIPRHLEQDAMYFHFHMTVQTALAEAMADPTLVDNTALGCNTPLIDSTALFREATGETAAGSDLAMEGARVSMHEWPSWIARRVRGDFGRAVHAGGVSGKVRQRPRNRSRCRSRIRCKSRSRRSKSRTKNRSRSSSRKQDDTVSRSGQDQASPLAIAMAPTSGAGPGAGAGAGTGASSNMTLCFCGCVGLCLSDLLNNGASATAMSYYNIMVSTNRSSASATVAPQGYSQLLPSAVRGLWQCGFQEAPRSHTFVMMGAEVGETSDHWSQTYVSMFVRRSSLAFPDACSRNNNSQFLASSPVRLFSVDAQLEPLLQQDQEDELILRNSSRWIATPILRGAQSTPRRIFWDALSTLVVVLLKV